MADEQSNRVRAMAARRQRLLSLSRRMRSRALQSATVVDGGRVAEEGGVQAPPASRSPPVSMDVSHDIQALLDRLQGAFESGVCICWGGARK